MEETFEQNSENAREAAVERFYLDAFVSVLRSVYKFERDGRGDVGED